MYELYEMYEWYEIYELYEMYELENGICYYQSSSSSSSLPATLPFLWLSAEANASAKLAG